MGRFINYLAAAGAGAAMATAGCGQSTAEAATPHEARAAVARGALLLDVRSPGEFGAGHLEGATNIPVDVLAQRAGELEAGQEVVVYCRSGKRSAAAAEILRGRGHVVVDLGPMSAY